MPFCGNCGTKVEAGEKFCGNCGANIEEQLSTPAVYQAQAPARYPVENAGSEGQNDLVLGVAGENGALQPAAKSNKKAVAIAVCAGVLVIVAAVLILFGLNASPERKMHSRSQEFFDRIAQMDLRGMLACVDPTEAKQVLDSLDELNQLAGGEDTVMQLLSRSFLQMAMGEAFDPSTIEKIVIEDFDADYDEDSLYADIDATVNIHFKDAQTARFKMEYQMVEYENNWYIAT